MRINYELKENLFKICNEYSGIDQFKKTLLKKGKLIPYTRFILMQLILVLFVTTILTITLHKTNVDIIVDCTLLMLFFVFLQVTTLALIYFRFKREPLNGTLIIDEYGILDENDKTRSGVAWNQIEAVVESNYAIYIVTKRSNMYVYNKEIFKSMIKEIKYYKRGIKLINITKKCNK